MIQKVFAEKPGQFDPRKYLGSARQSGLFYDELQDRIGICQEFDRRVSRHRTGSIAACWLTDHAIATSNELFAVNTQTGMSPMLFNSQWIPARFVPATGQRLLLGKDKPRRFAIIEITFKPRPNHPPSQLAQGNQRSRTLPNPRRQARKLNPNDPMRYKWAQASARSSAG